MSSVYNENKLNCLVPIGCQSLGRIQKKRVLIKLFNLSENMDDDETKNSQISDKDKIKKLVRDIGILKKAY